MTSFMLAESSTRTVLKWMTLFCLRMSKPRAQRQFEKSRKARRNVCVDLWGLVANFRSLLPKRCLVLSVMKWFRRQNAFVTKIWLHPKLSDGEVRFSHFFGFVNIVRIPAVVFSPMASNKTIDAFDGHAWDIHYFSLLAPVTALLAVTVLLLKRCILAWSTFLLDFLAGPLLAVILIIRVLIEK